MEELKFTVVNRFGLILGAFATFEAAKAFADQRGAKVKEPGDLR